MKFGLVGIGKWGMTVAAKLRDLGHAVACYSRHDQKKAPAVGMGDLVPWVDLPDLCDAVVVATPPDATAKIARHMITAGVPVLLTKPLIGASELLTLPLTAPAYVDYVHLHSPSWWNLCDEVDRQVSISPLAKIEAHFYGDGPIRTFPAVWDYGAHAAAVSIDLLGGPNLDVKNAVRASSATGRELYRIGAVGDDGVEVQIMTGNDSQGQQRARVVAQFKNGKVASYEEDFPAATFTPVAGSAVTAKHDPLNEILEAFIEDAQGQKVDPADLLLSAKVEELIRSAQRLAGQSP